jgi:hypothetical protein
MAGAAEKRYGSLSVEDIDELNKDMDNPNTKR